QGVTEFEEIEKLAKEKGWGKWGPFESKKMWELAKFIFKNMNQSKIDEFLELETVHLKPETVKAKNDIAPPFKNCRELLKRIDELPRGAEWSCDLLTVVGDVGDADGKKLVEVLELWRRNPEECVRELIGKTSIRNMGYAPQKVFLDKEGKEQRIDEMWTANAWSDLQEQLPEGATVVPIILGSDKTQLSVFTGDKSSWPVYITIGNIPKADRRCPSKRTQTLLGYLPVTKLKIFSKKETRKFEIYRLFHRCMRIILGPLYSKGRQATEMVCAD
ncbi:hypothetical protein SCHPADRAFT_798623, partial [Schizopora paradoxa]